MDLIVQSNLLNNDMLLKIKEAISDLPHQFVGLIPFSREITSNVPIEGLDHIPYGSTSFIETTYALGWKGLSFDQDQFSYAKAVANRSDMLNGDVILPAAAMVDLLKGKPREDLIFIRPSHDLKQFSGAVYSVGDALDYLQDAMACASSGSYKIEPDFPIVASEPKTIVSEWRWFIIGGEVIDGSLYRRHGQLTKAHVDDPDLIEEAKKFASGWLPNKCCVMDLALLATGGTKVIEFNCLNGSGFYEHDIKKVMSKLYDYHCESS